MSEKVKKYLRENKGKYPQKQLIEALEKGGYSKQDIKKSVEEVYGDKAVFDFNFWDFKHRAVYTAKREKWLDLLLGIGAALVASIALSFAPIGLILFLILYISALIFTFNKRRYFFYGLLCYLLLSILLLIIGIVVVLNGFLSLL